MNVATIAALPNAVAVLGEHNALFNVLQQFAITLFVTLLNGPNATEFNSKFGETVLDCLLSHGVIHVGPLVVFARSCVGKVRSCRGNVSLVQELEPQFCMLFLVKSSLCEELCNLLIAVFLGL